MVVWGFIDMNFIIPWFLFGHTHTKKKPVEPHQAFWNPYFLPFRLQQLLNDDFSTFMEVCSLKMSWVKYW